MNLKGRALMAGFGLVMAAGMSRALSRTAFGGMAMSYGNITLESKSPKSVYAQALKIVHDMNASVISYNAYTNPQTGKTQVSAQFQVDRDKAPEFMSQLAALAEVKNQNLSQSYGGQNTEQLKKQLADLDKELKTIPGTRYPVLVAYGLQQRQSLQIQLQQAQNVANSATVSLSIQEPGQDQPAAGKLSTLMGWPAVALALIAFAVGALLAKRNA